jgi:hypothetical protein
LLQRPGSGRIDRASLIRFMTRVPAREVHTG